MTQEDIKHIKRVLGDNYDEIDIPTYLRQRDKENKARMEEAIIEEMRQIKKIHNYQERVNNFLIDEFEKLEK